MTIVQSGKKIDDEFENPVDNLIINNICEPLTIPLSKLKFPPNIITTIGLVFGILAIYFIIKGKYLMGILFYSLYYVFDCQDGYFARKYNMVTEFGDYYDHMRDLFVNGIVFALIIWKLPFELRYVYIIIISLLMFMLAIHMGCQECNSKYKNANDCLKIYKKLCYNKNLIKYTRYFGCATLILTTILFLGILQVLKN